MRSDDLFDIHVSRINTMNNFEQKKDMKIYYATNPRVIENGNYNLFAIRCDNPMIHLLLTDNIDCFNMIVILYYNIRKNREIKVNDNYLRNAISKNSSLTIFDYYISQQLLTVHTINFDRRTRPLTNHTIRTKVEFIIDN